MIHINLFVHGQSQQIETHIIINHELILKRPYRNLKHYTYFFLEILFLAWYFSLPLLCIARPAGKKTPLYFDVCKPNLFPRGIYTNQLKLTQIPKVCKARGMCLILDYYSLLYAIIFFLVNFMTNTFKLTSRPIITVNQYFCVILTLFGFEVSF